MTAEQPPRRVVIVAYPGCQILDVAGPHEVFAGANELIAGSYEVTVATTGGGIVASESGLALATTDLPSTAGGIDTVLVVGGRGVHEARRDERLVAFLRQAASTVRRVGSVCSGTFLLGDAGLIDGRRVTTHWARAGRLAAEFPTARVDPDPIHVHDGVWSSAGVTAGIDLSLALVEDDLGAATAQTIAQWLVMFLRRPGGQSQFAGPVWTDLPDHGGIRAAVDAVRADPAAGHTVDSLAAVAAMSSRHFTRVFSREVGLPPARFVEQVRVDAARRLLESTTATTESVARRCGFGTGETMRRSFIRCLGTPPGTYRRTFGHVRDMHPPEPEASSIQPSPYQPS